MSPSAVAQLERRLGRRNGRGTQRLRGYRPQQSVRAEQHRAHRRQQRRASGSFAGTINGSAGFSLAKVGSGTQVLGGAGNDPYLTAIVNNGVLVLAKSSGASVNALGGTGTALTINGGTAQLAGNGGNQIYDQAGVVANGGVFDFNGQNEAFDALNGGTAGLILNNAPATASTMTVGQNNGGGTFAGTIADGLGTLALTKAGSGTLVLTGSNTNSGLTTVSGGILQIGNGGTTGSIASNVLNNGVLTFNRATPSPAQASSAAAEPCARPARDLDPHRCQQLHGPNDHRRRYAASGRRRHYRLDRSDQRRDRQRHPGLQPR